MAFGVFQSHVQTTRGTPNLRQVTTGGVAEELDSKQSSCSGEKLLTFEKIEVRLWESFRTTLYGAPVLL